MSEIPKDKINCDVCIHRQKDEDGIIHGTDIGDSCCHSCEDKSEFEIDFDAICKWCYSPVAPGDNICWLHREIHARNSWPGCIEYDKGRR